MGQRGKQNWVRTELPVGAIRVRKHSKRQSARMIKVRLDGPPGRRWMTLARAWWLENRGPIPGGMRVVHGDGDPLNDDPANYVLATAGDVAFMAREWDPELDERNSKAVSIATVRCNQERSMVRRALEYLPSHWYAVDMDHREVINQPFRSRSKLYRELTGADVENRNGRGLAGRWLGWPDLNQTAAAVLAVLANDPCWSYELLRLVNELLALHSWGGGIQPASLWSNGTVRLKQLGWICVERVTGKAWRRYRISAAGLAARENQLPYVAVRGEEIDARFPGYAKVWPDSGRAVRRCDSVLRQEGG